MDEIFAYFILTYKKNIILWIFAIFDQTRAQQLCNFIQLNDQIKISPNKKLDFSALYSIIWSDKTNFSHIISIRIVPGSKWAIVNFFDFSALYSFIWLDKIIFGYTTSIRTVNRSKWAIVKFQNFATPLWP